MHTHSTAKDLKMLSNALQCYEENYIAIQLSAEQSQGIIFCRLYLRIISESRGAIGHNETSRNGVLKPPLFRTGIPSASAGWVRRNADLCARSHACSDMHAVTYAVHRAKYNPVDCNRHDIKFSFARKLGSKHTVWALT